MNDSGERISTKKVGVILLTGFLGSGKTTLMKQILSWETDLSDTVVIVNEFGDVGIDGVLLKTFSTNVVELSSGCICCTMSTDLNKSLKRILNEFKPARIIIESSGVSDPTAISTVLSEPDLNRSIVLEKIIAVLDVEFWEGREMFGPLFYHQLEMAHLILLNKIDLLDIDQVPAYLKEIYDAIPHSKVVPTIQCRVDPATIWADPQPKGFDLKPMDFFKAESNRKYVAATHYDTFSFQTSSRMNESRFKQFLDGLPLELFRIKGPARLVDRTVMVNFVGGRGEWLPWEDQTETQLVFIGWNVDRQKTLSQLEQCLI